MRLIALLVVFVLAPIVSAQEYLKDRKVQVQIAPAHRVANVGNFDAKFHGNCAYASLETLGLHHGITALKNLSQEYAYGAYMADLVSLLTVRGVKHEYRKHYKYSDVECKQRIDDESKRVKDIDFLVDAVATRKLGALVAGHGHAKVLVHIDYQGCDEIPYRVRDGDQHGVKTVKRYKGYVGIIDNADWEQRIRRHSMQEFMAWFEGMAIVVHK